MDAQTFSPSLRVVWFCHHYLLHKNINEEVSNKSCSQKLWLFSKPTSELHIVSQKLLLPIEATITIAWLGWWYFWKDSFTLDLVNCNDFLNNTLFNLALWFKLYFSFRESYDLILIWSIDINQNVQLIPYLTIIQRVVRFQYIWEILFIQGCKLVRGEKGDKLNSTPPPPLIYTHMGGNRRVPHDTI